MMALVYSLLAILAAPLLDRAVRRQPTAAGVADGMIQVTVGGILLVHVLPFGLAAAGWPALAALGGGALVGVLAHRVPGGERSAGALAAVALLLHSGIDGAALASPDEDHQGGLLAWAVVLHTVPVGLATWRIARARGGTAIAGGLLAATAAATLFGYWATEHVAAGASPAALGVAQCAVAGALLHVLGHASEGGPRRAAGVGALLGVAVVAALAWTHPVEGPAAGELSAGEALRTLLLVAAPPLVLGYIATGLLHALVPESTLDRLTGARRRGVPRGEAGPDTQTRSGGLLGDAARGAVLGVPMPVCSCGAVPAYADLRARGTPTATGLAFLVAGPEIGVGALLVSLPFLGPALSGVRVVAALLVAVFGAGVAAIGAGAGGIAAGSINAKSISTESIAARSISGAGVARRPLRERLRAGAVFGLVETVDHTAPWVLAGLGVAALAEPFLSSTAFANVPAPLAVIGAALAGVPAYVCAAGATPLVAVLLHKGASAGSALAFLLTGPATNVVTFTALRRLHGRRVAIAFGAAVAIGAIAVGVTVDAVWPDLAAPPLHAASASANPLAWAAVVVLLALYAAALLRNGAAGFLEPLLHPHEHDEDGGAASHSHSAHSHSAHSHGTHSHGAHSHGAHAHGQHDHAEPHSHEDGHPPRPARER